MRRILMAVVVLGAGMPVAAGEAESPAERGRRALLTRSYNPPTMALESYDTAWKHWGIDQKPAEYERRFLQRYGLHPAPYANGGLPMGLRIAENTLPLGPRQGISTDCLICHGGSIFGRSYVGLGNATLDFQAFYEELAGPPGRRVRSPFTFTNVRGTVEAGGMSVFLLGFREPDLSLRLVRRDLDLRDDLCEDVPAWWILKKKTTMYYTGGADVRSSRAIMQFMMSPLNFPSAFHKAEADFKDIRAYLLAIEAPKYPLPIDRPLAARGEVVFAAHCARCHGSYGARPSYPNKIIPLKQIGTDPRRFEGITGKFAEYYDRSWFAGDYKALAGDGYQAPPLDGIWATAPYLHNGSVPTLYDLLHSKTRPVRFTRSYATERADYDERQVGWKVQTVSSLPDAKTTPALERRKVYDTTQPGRSNRGHTFGDRLSDPERWAVIEYLKTL